MNWDCCCVHPDPRECAKLRDRKTAEILGEPYNDWNMKRVCECCCHDDCDDEDDWDDDWVNPAKRTLNKKPRPKPGLKHYED